MAVVAVNGKSSASVFRELLKWLPQRLSRPSRVVATGEDEGISCHTHIELHALVRPTASIHRIFC